MPSQQVLDEKSTEVESIKDIFKEYKSIGIASLRKVRASQLQELKKSMKGQVYLRVLKNTLIKIAIEEMNQAELKKLEEYLEGSNIFLFTDLNPFKLAMLLERGKVKTTAKSGDIAAIDVLSHRETRGNRQVQLSANLTLSVYRQESNQAASGSAKTHWLSVRAK